MEGKISSQFRRIQEFYLVGTSSFMTAELWSKTFVGKILQITHSQWIFRNFMLHNRTLGYLHLTDRLNMIQEIEHLLETREDEVPHDPQFLLEFDIQDISGMNFDSQNYWVQAVHAARNAQTGILQRSLPGCVASPCSTTGTRPLTDR